MMTVFYSKDAQFELEDDEFKTFILKANTGEKVYIPRLKVFLSGMFIWAGEKPKDRNRLPLHDGGFAIKKHGTWIDERSGSVIDLHYYPYLAREMTKEEYEATKLLN